MKQDKKRNRNQNILSCCLNRVALLLPCFKQTGINCDLWWCLEINNMLLQRAGNILYLFLIMHVITYFLIHLFNIHHEADRIGYIVLPYFICDKRKTERLSAFSRSVSDRVGENEGYRCDCLNLQSCWQEKKNLQSPWYTFSI